MKIVGSDFYYVYSSIKYIVERAQTHHSFNHSTDGEVVADGWVVAVCDGYKQLVDAAISIQHYSFKLIL